MLVIGKDEEWAGELIFDESRSQHITYGWWGFDMNSCPKRGNVTTTQGQIHSIYTCRLMWPVPLFMQELYCFQYKHPTYKKDLGHSQ